MAVIDFSRKHQLNSEDARRKVEEMAEHFAVQYDLKTSWTGNTVAFEGNGVSGTIRSEPGEIRVFVELSMFVSLLKGKIEAGIREELEKSFG